MLRITGTSNSMICGKSMERTRFERRKPRCSFERKLSLLVEWKTDRKGRSSITERDRKPSPNTPAIAALRGGGGKRTQKR